MSYLKNKMLARTRNTKPTLTDQSQAKETDRHVIVTRFLQTGQAFGSKPPMYGDFSQFPTSMRDYIDLARSLRSRHNELPDELRKLSVQELLSLTPEQLKAKLAPPAQPPEAKKEGDNK